MKEIDSGYERLVLDYESISTEGGDDLLDINESGVERIDSLYSSKTVYSSSDVSNWYRYIHVKRDNTANDISATNPYKKNDSIYGHYLRETASNSNFNHGYLESPRLDEGTIDVVPGDIYEVKTNISGCAYNAPIRDGCFFDINLASGDNSEPVSPSATTLDGKEYETTIKQPIFSTFNQAIKWFTHGNNDPGLGLNTSNFFVMPNLPSAYEGFHIQVGPANSDNKFDTPPEELLWANGATEVLDHPITGNSYFKEACDNTNPSYNAECANYLRSGDNIPQNFSIGIPWWMLNEFYSSCLWEAGFYYCPPYPLDSTPVFLSFWWNDHPTSEFPSVPTKAGPEYSLDEVSLVRYSKNPYMLKTARKQIYNAGTAVLNNPDDVWHTVEHLEFEHEITLAPRYGNSLDTLGNVQYEYEGLRNVILLTKITQLPYQEGGGNNIPLVTSFGYNTIDTLLDNPIALFIVPQYSSIGVQDNDIQSPNLNSNYFTLNIIIDPLGKTTAITYSDIGDKSYALKKFNYKLRPNEDIGAHEIRQAPSYAFQVNMVVETVTVSEREGAGGSKCWTYDFPATTVKYDDYPFFNDHFDYDYQYDLRAGFSQVSVYGPSNSCGVNSGPKTIYKHHIDNLKFGKLYETDSYDASGTLLSKNDISYEALVAFESPAHRESQDLVNSHFDYSEYLFDGNRPVLSGDFEAYNDAIHDYIQSLNPLNLIPNGYSDTPTEPVEPVFNDCDGSGSSCGCEMYDDLPSNQQHECDDYFNELYLWFLFSPQGWYTPYKVDHSPNLYYESKYDQEIEDHDGTHNYSFFIKKTGETSTIYDQDCEEGSGGEMTSTTSYEYFDAYYNGTSTCTGYKYFGVDSSFLFWEPSWQLYKKTTTSGAYQTTEEYFYLWDLISNDEFLYNDNFQIIEPDYNMLSILWWYKGKRDLAYQKRVTKTSPGGTNQRSTYYVYSMDWEDVNSVDTIINLVDPDIDNPCPGIGNGGSGNTGNPDLPVGFNYNIHPPSAPPQQLYCEEIHSDTINAHVYATPCGSNKSGQSGGTYFNYSPSGDSVVQMVSFSLKGKIYLKSVVEQVAPPANGQDDDLILNLVGSMEEPNFPYDTLTVQTIHSRNSLGLVVNETDEKDLVIDYTYEKGYNVEYIDCSYNPPRLRSIYLSNFVALPITVTLGGGLPDALTTKFDYYIEDNNIKTITDPNEMELLYEYDGFGRMANAYRNGDLIQSVEYSNANAADSTFAGSAALNFVDVFNCVEGKKGWGSKGFVDPLGRKVATVNYSGGSKVAVEDNIFDIYNRAEQQLKKHIGDVPTVDKGENCGDLNFEYDIAPRDRALKSAKYGECLNGQHTVGYEYCILSSGDVIDEIVLAGRPLAVAQAYITDSFYQRTETTDEDDKSVITFTDGGGNTAATITNNGTVATLFKYDAFGNVSEVSNAKEQVMDYTYNFIGQLKSKSSPDEGTWDFAYNQSGQLICQRDGNLDIRAFDYDPFGRITIQAKAKDQYGMLDPLKDASPWINNRTYDFLDNALSGATKEKEWFYQDYNPNFTIDSEIENDYLTNIGFSKGRLVHSVSYDMDGTPIELKFLSFNDDGFLDWEITQFGESGVGTNYNAVVISYPEYNLQGSYKTQNVDILGEGGPVDYQHYFVYDSWNRISKVYAHFGDLKGNGHLAAHYIYDDVLGTVVEKDLFNSDFMEGGELCKNLQVDSVFFGFDARERLTSINSVLFGYALGYDSTDINGSSLNFNGNINGTIASYSLDEDYVINTPDNFFDPTEYGYFYDNLNRLVEAKANTSIFSPYVAINYSGDPNVLGDVKYYYDKIGNFTSIERGNVYKDDADVWQFGTSIFSYTYPGTSNKLSGISASGLLPPNCTNGSYSYGYDGNGNLTNDTRKGITGVGYGRANLPYAISMSATCENPEQGSFAQYLYDTGDARLYKRTAEGREYYQRDAAGHELFVYNKDSDKYTWYIYGNERIAKIGDAPTPDDVDVCRPKPACEPGMILLQQAYLQNLTYVTSTDSIDYPTKLFRIRLCDGFEAHLLASELDGLVGNYIILQQIDILDASQELSVWQTNGLTVLDMAAVLTLRINNDQFLLNGYSSCEPFQCPVDLIACSEGPGDNSQAASIAALQTEYANTGPEDVLLPTRLVRIRLCDGTETYVLLEMLGQIEGDYTILQQIEITSTEQTFSVVVNAENEKSSDFTTVLYLLLDLEQDIVIDGYIPCVNDEPCMPTLPECSYQMASDQIEVLQTMQQVFLLASTDDYTYPTKLYRIRLCYGDELYVMKEELDNIPGNFRYLQEITVTSPNQLFQMKVDNGNQIINETGDLAQLLGHRRGERGSLFSVGDYLPCGELSPCHPDAPSDCTPEELAAQEHSVQTLMAQMESLNHTTLSFPNHMYLVRFCDGNTLYVLEKELDIIEGSHSILQSIDLTGLSQTFEVLVTSGTNYTVTLDSLLTLRITEPGITVNGYGCGEATVEQNVSCIYTIDQQNWDTEFIPNEPDSVKILYEKVITQNCGEGPVEILRVQESKNLDIVYIGGFREWVGAYYVTPCDTIFSEYELYIHSGVFPDYPWIVHLKNKTINTTATCNETQNNIEVVCGPPIIVNIDSTYIACDENEDLPDPDGDGCPGQTVINTDISEINYSAGFTTEQNISYPNAFKKIKFSDGREALVLDSEVSHLDDCYETEETTPIDSANQVYYAHLPMGSGNANLHDVLALRATGVAMSLEEPEPDLPLPGDSLGGSGLSGFPKFTFFIYDHLGNSRILYTNDLVDCNPDSTKYLLEHVLDYYPFSKTLREYIYVRERHQSTYHERDEETGLDYRGARFYDSEVGRFLSVDPLAEKYYAWSPYNYVLGNPIRFIDPDGKAVDDHIFVNSKGEEIHRIKDPNENTVVIVPDENLKTLKSGEYVSSENYKKSLGVTYEIEGADKLYGQSMNSQADPKQVSDKNGNPRNDVHLEYGANLKVSEDGKTVSVGEGKAGNPHNFISDPLASDEVGDIHTHPNEGKGLIVLNGGAQLNTDNKRGPSSIDKGKRQPKPGYFNMLVDDKAYYFYKGRNSIIVPKNKFNQ